MRSSSALQPEARGVEVVECVFAGAGEIAEGFIRHRGHIDGREIAGASEAGQGHGVARVGLHAIARLARDQRGGNDKARQALPGEVPVEPVAAGAGLVDEHEPRALALELAHEGIDVALPRADGAEGHGGRRAILGRVGDGDGLLVHIETDVECASVSHGWPPIS